MVVQLMPLGEIEDTSGLVAGQKVYVTDVGMSVFAGFSKSGKNAWIVPPDNTCKPVLVRVSEVFVCFETYELDKNKRAKKSILKLI